MLQKQNLEMQKNPVIEQLKKTMLERQAKVKDLVETMAEKNFEHEQDLNQFKTRFAACENTGHELLEATNKMIEKHQLVQKMAKKVFIILLFLFFYHKMNQKNVLFI